MTVCREVVRWIAVPAEGADEPEHPAPVLRLVEAADGDPAGAADASPPGDGQGGDDDDGAPTGLAVAGVVLGALGLLAGGTALLRGRAS